MRRVDFGARVRRGHTTDRRAAERLRRKRIAASPSPKSAWLAPRFGARETAHPDAAGRDASGASPLEDCGGDGASPVSPCDAGGSGTGVVSGGVGVPVTHAGTG